jgi:ribonucleoside-diphosphate reductase beta chain
MQRLLEVNMTRKSEALELYQLAKKYRWDPAAIDLTTDARDWAALQLREQDILNNLCSMFIAGEEAVASDLAPLLWRVGKRGGQRADEMFLTTQLFDESLHVEFFDRWFREVVCAPVDRAGYYGPSYRAVFFAALPSALDDLLTDASSQALARAYLTYHIIVEGTLAETGYHAAFLACQRRSVLPGLVRGFEHIKQDESRHIAYGLLALQNLLEAEPALWDYYNDTLNELLNHALGVVPEALERYGDDIPFGISLSEMTEYAMDQFGKRLAVIERVK